MEERQTEEHILPVGARGGGESLEKAEGTEKCPLPPPRPPGREPGDPRCGGAAGHLIN